MSEIIITKILLGIIFTTIVAFVLQVVNKLIEKKVEEMSSSKKIGFLVFLVLLVIYYVGILFYWLGLLGESLE